MWIIYAIMVSERRPNGKLVEVQFWVCWLVGWWVVLRIYVASAVFQRYCDLEAGDNQSLKIQVASPRIEPRYSCSASQEFNHSATAAPSSPWQSVLITHHQAYTRRTYKYKEEGGYNIAIRPWKKGL